MVLSRFFAGINDANVGAALTGALDQWIVSNATAIPVLIILGFVTGGTTFFLATMAQAADFVEDFVEQIITQEIANGVLSNDEAKEVKAWAKAGDGILQLPSILTDENTITRVFAGITADVNFESESQDTKLGVTIANNTVGKWVMAFSTLKKTL